MKKNAKKILILTFALMSNLVNAQTYQWAKSLGGSAPEYGHSVTADASGNVYTAGYFQGTADFDPGAGTANQTSAGNFDGFIQKMTPAGTFLWVKTFGSTTIDEVRSVRTDNAGNVYCTGSFQGTVDFDPGAGTTNLTSAGAYDAFVLKLDPSGNLLWAKRFGSTADDQARSLVVDASGNVTSTGMYTGTVDFDPGSGNVSLVSAGVTDGYIQKLDASGNFIWANRFGGSSTEQPYSIDMDASGNVALIGIFTGSGDFDPGAGTTTLTSAGGQDVFVSKFDVSGNFVWAKRFGNANGELGQSLVIDDATGSMYMTGQFSGTVDFNPGSGTQNVVSAGGQDVYILKLDAAGNFVWLRQLGSASFEYGMSVSLDSQANVYTLGGFQGAMDFDPGAGTTTITPSGGQNAFIQKMTAAGDYVWSCGFGNGGYVSPYSIFLDASNSILTSGAFNQAGDFNPEAGVTTLTPTGGSQEVFVQRFSQCITPNTGVLSGNQSVCVGSTTTFSSTVSGGSWSSSNTGIATIDPTTGVVTGTGGGTATMTYTVNGTSGCPNATITRTVTVTALPNPGTLSGPTTICFGETGNFSSTVSGGGWSSSNTSVATVDLVSGVVTPVSAGTTILTYTVSGVADCQNTATTTVTVNNPSTGTDTQVTCTAFTWIDGITYTTSNNTATFTLTNSVGCDSVVTLNLTINGTTGIDTQVACETFTWIDGNTYTASNNTATYTALNGSGCDSVVTLNLTIYQPNTGVDVITACKFYTWIDGITYNASNNLATFTLTNVGGCDSVVTLNLTIDSSQPVSDITTTVNGTTITANNTNATYQWLDCENGFAPIIGETNQTFTPTINGSYAVEITENSCIDTSLCVNITGLGFDDLIDGIQVLAYPNPTTDNVHVVFEKPIDDVEIVLTDMIGKTVFVQRYESLNSTTIEMPASTGVYILIVSTKAGQSKMKIEKQ